VLSNAVFRAARSRGVMLSFLFVVLIAAIAAIKADRAAALPPPCRPVWCDPEPLLPPPPTTRTVKLGDLPRAVADNGAEHQRSSGQVLLVRRISDNAPLRAYVFLTTHAWTFNMWVGFTSVTQAQVTLDGAPLPNTSQRRISVTGTWGGGSDKTESWTEDLDLNKVASATSAAGQISLIFEH
jgi:hypothetical protein